MNCPIILAFVIPNANIIPISFFLAFIHNNNSKLKTTPAKIKLPKNNLSATLYIPEIDCCNAG